MRAKFLLIASLWGIALASLLAANLLPLRAQPWHLFGVEWWLFWVVVYGLWCISLFYAVVLNLRNRRNQV